MTAIAFSQFKKRMNEHLQEMEATGEPLTVTRADGNDFVIMSAQEWESIQETLHIMSSPENVKRLRAAHSESRRRLPEEKKRQLEVFWTAEAAKDLNWWKRTNKPIAKKDR
ncbi:MAG: type II toxin-antitoxin system Phd/YefM family antitoxin [Burkholderiales bacterium]